MQSDLQLKRLFNQFNRWYWRGTLPDDVVLYYETVPGGYGDCNQLEDGEFVIRVNPAHAAWTEIVKLILLHECIHLRCWPYRGHDGAFDRERQRLMKYKSVRKLI